MYKILAFLTKRADMSTDDSIGYYENHHVPLVVSLSGDTLPILYKRRYTRRGSGNEIRTGRGRAANRLRRCYRDGLC